MDPTVIKTILESQNQAYKSALEIFVGQFNQKMQSLQTTVSDLQRSLEFSQKEVDDLKNGVNKLQSTHKQDQDLLAHMTTDLQTKSDRIKELEERCNNQEDQSRQNNLQFVGVEEQQDESWEQTAVHVTKLLEDKLQLPNIEMERVHRVGQRVDLRPRPIIARFSRFCDREAVLRNASKLRGTGVYVNEDLCPASQRIRKEKLPLLKQARSEGKIAYFRHTKLIIKKKPDMYIGTGGGRSGTAMNADAGGGGGVVGDSVTPGPNLPRALSEATVFTRSDSAVSGVVVPAPTCGSSAVAVKTTPTPPLGSRSRTSISRK